MPLGSAPRGFRGRIVGLRPEGVDTSLTAAELERRLLELGFVEGEEVEIAHEGTFGRDPIAVHVGGTTIGLRRREAMAILVRQVA